MTCKDCIHFKVCEFEGIYFEDVAIEASSADSIEALCLLFENKADFVEVVKCEKCKKAKPLNFGGFYFCRRYRVCRKADAFCSYGERRENERTEENAEGV